MLEGLTGDGYALDLEKLRWYATRLSRVIEQQEQRPEGTRTMEAYEMLGRKVLELERLNANYDQLLQVMNWIACGEVDASRVSVDLGARTWTLAPKIIEVAA